MKTIKLFILENCPYCRRALSYLADLQTETDYSTIAVELIDESKDRAIADTYDYYYVPAIYYREEKLHEGVLSQERLREILDYVKEETE